MDGTSNQLGRDDLLLDSSKKITSPPGENEGNPEQPATSDQSSPSSGTTPYQADKDPDFHKTRAYMILSDEYALPVRRIIEAINNKPTTEDDICLKASLMARYIELHLNQ